MKGFQKASLLLIQDVAIFLTYRNPNIYKLSNNPKSIPNAYWISKTKRSFILPKVQVCRQFTSIGICRRGKKCPLKDLMAISANLFIPVTVCERESNLEDKSWGPIIAGHSLTDIRNYYIPYRFSCWIYSCLVQAIWRVEDTLSS